jgi:hypothetical protein
LFSLCPGAFCLSGYILRREKAASRVPVEVKRPQYLNKWGRGEEIEIERIFYLKKTLFPEGVVP